MKPYDSLATHLACDSAYQRIQKRIKRNNKIMLVVMLIALITGLISSIVFHDYHSSSIIICTSVVLDLFVSWVNHLEEENCKDRAKFMDDLLSTSCLTGQKIDDPKK